jgi:hypothetical protein
MKREAVQEERQKNADKEEDEEELNGTLNNSEMNKRITADFGIDMNSDERKLIETLYHSDNFHFPTLNQTIETVKLINLNKNPLTNWLSSFNYNFRVFQLI